MSDIDHEQLMKDAHFILAKAVEAGEGSVLRERTAGLIAEAMKARIKNDQIKQLGNLRLSSRFLVRSTNLAPHAIF